MPRRNLQILLLSIAVCLVCYFRGTRHRYAPTIADAMGIISDYYIEPVDRRDLYEHAMQGMVSNLDDYSGYIPPVSYNQLQEELDQEFAGVGIEVGIDPDSKRLIVLSPILNSPAYRSGLRAGDLIMTVDGSDTEGMELEDSVKLMRGKPGTSVALSVRPFGNDELTSVNVERANVHVGSVLGDTRNRDGSWNYVLADHPEIAYLRLSGFGEATGREVAESLEPLLKTTTGLIVDLRGNPGGLLTAAVDVCDLFLDQSTVVSVRRRGGFINPNDESSPRDAIVAETYKSSDDVLVPAGYPVAVLIDGYSASASEIVAACLQDYERATVVGQRSWGKGTVQNVFDLEGGKSALKLTIATYWRPSGTNIHRFSTDGDEDDWGVKPNAGYEIVYNREDSIRRLRDRRIRDFVPEVRKSQVKVEAMFPDIDEDTQPDVVDDTVPGDSIVDKEPHLNVQQSDEQAAESNAIKPQPDDEAVPINTIAEPFDDTQLKRAIECIESAKPAANRKAA